MSGPAQRIASSLGSVTKNAQQAATATNAYTRAQAAAVNAQSRYIRTQATMLRAQTSMTRAQIQATRVQQQLNRAQQGGRGGARGHLLGSMAGFGLGAAGLYAATRAVERVADVVTFLPRHLITGGIEHTALKESAVAGMGTVLGSESKAQRIVREAIRFAAITPMTTEETLKGYQQLIMGGIAPNKVLGIMSALSDLSSINMARRPEAVQMIAQDLMQIQAAGKVSGRHLRNLSHWGLPRQEVFRQLTEITPALRGASADVVERAVSAGRVSADAFFLAFERAMAVRGGGKLGGISEKQSRTMLGLWSTLISRPQELLMNMDQTPAWNKLKTALENLVSVTDYNTPTGARIQETLSTAFSKWVDKLTGWLQEPAAVEKFVDRMLGTFERLVPAFEQLAGALPPFIEQMSKITAVAGRVTEGYGRVFKWSPVGMAMDVGEEVSNAADWAWDHAKRARNFLALPAVPKGSPKRLTSSTTTANVNVHVDGATREDAKIVGHEVRSQIADLFEQLGIESGAAGVMP